MTAGPSITIRPVTDARGLRDWLEAPAIAHQGTNGWIRPLDLMERQRISPRHNPFFSFGEAAFFVAYAGGRPVGRISAQVNRQHLARHADATGHFGFFACIDDRAAARALVEAAKGWLAERGMRRMQGPFALTINEDAGLLVEGFEHPPAILSSHAPPWAAAQLEACGLAKAIDLLAYRMQPRETPPEIARLARLASQSGRIRLRNLDMARYGQEVALAFDIFNDAWSDNWGFVPVSAAETAALARDTRPLMRAKFGWIAEIDGEPAAMMVVLPDINRVIAPFHGRLLPFNWAKLAHEIWRDRWKTARVPLLGVRKRYRHTALAPGVLSLMVAGLIELGRSYDLDWVEFSWVLETNRAMTRLAEIAAGPPAKTYRIYETALSPGSA